MTRNDEGTFQTIFSGWDGRVSNITILLLSSTRIQGIFSRELMIAGLPN